MYNTNTASVNTHPTVTEDTVRAFNRICDTYKLTVEEIPCLCGINGRACNAIFHSDQKADRALCMGCPLRSFAKEYEALNGEVVPPYEVYFIGLDGDLDSTRLVWTMFEAEAMVSLFKGDSDIYSALEIHSTEDEGLISRTETKPAVAYTVAAYCSEEDSEADTDIIEENSYSTATEAINAAKERIREAEEDNEAIRVAVYADEDETLYEGITTGTAYRLFEDYGTPVLGAVAYSAEEAAQALNDWLCDSYEGEEAYKEMLDECNEMVTIGSLSYYPSVALERIDPTAYRCGLVDWADAEYSAALYDIERMEYGDIVSFYGWNCKLVHIAEEIDYTADNRKWVVCR